MLQKQGGLHPSVPSVNLAEITVPMKNTRKRLLFILLRFWKQIITFRNFFKNLTLKNHQIKVLNLTDNLIQHISEDAFTDFRYLLSLDISKEPRLNTSALKESFYSLLFRSENTLSSKLWILFLAKDTLNDGLLLVANGLNKSFGTSFQPFLESWRYNNEELRRL
jgi:hypothetical protein